jgi:hypothetical protein
LEVGESTNVEGSGTNEVGSGGARVLVLGKAGEVACVIEVVEDGRWWGIFGSGEVVVGKDVTRGVGGGDGYGKSKELSCEVAIHFSFLTGGIEEGDLSP